MTEYLLKILHNGLVHEHCRADFPPSILFTLALEVENYE